MSSNQRTTSSKGMLWFSWLVAAVALLFVAVLLVRVIVCEALLADSRSVVKALIVGQPAAEIQRRLIPVAPTHPWARDLDFGDVPYSDDHLYFGCGISMIRIGTSNGKVTDFDLRKFEHNRRITLNDISTTGDLPPLPTRAEGCP